MAGRDGAHYHCDGMGTPPIRIDDGLADQLAQPESAPLRELFDDWQAKAAGRAMPARADIEPPEIARLLPWLFLVDLVEGDGGATRFRFRLVGTGITGMEGEITGKHLDELIPDPVDSAMARHYADAAAGRVHLRHETLYWEKRGHIRYDVLLPMADDAGGVMLMGMARHRQP